MVGVLTSGAVVLNAGDSTDTKTAVSQYTESEKDSIWRCVNRLTEEFRTHNTQQREQWIKDSLNSIFDKQETKYIRDDIADIKRILQYQSRSFAAR